MATPKEHLHRLIEALPDSATEPAQRFLQWILQWILDEEAETDLVALTAQDWDAVHQGEEELTDGDYVRLAD